MGRTAISGKYDLTVTGVYSMSVRFRSPVAYGVAYEINYLSKNRICDFFFSI